MARNEYKDWDVFGTRIREYRKQIGLTTEKLSEMIDRTETYLILLEKGYRSCSLHTVHMLSKALKIPVDTLLYGEKMKDKDYTDKEIIKSIIDRCDEKELAAIKDVIVAMYPHLENVISKK